MNTLAAALQQYFTSYARAQRDLSPNTIAAYRDTWRMLITHLTETLGVPAGRIGLPGPGRRPRHHVP
jgi:integrase/recombinase XerD